MKRYCIQRRIGIVYVLSCGTLVLQIVGIRFILFAWKCCVLYFNRARTCFMLQVISCIVLHSTVSISLSMYSNFLVGRIVMLLYLLFPFFLIYGNMVSTGWLIMFNSCLDCLERSSFFGPSFSHESPRK